MADTIIDIEQRIEKAASELLKAYAIVTDLVTAARVVYRNDTSHEVDYPSATIQAIAFMEDGKRTGWYKGALQLSGITYRVNDKSKGKMKSIVGALRSWGQQDNLPAQFNATASAQASGSELDVRDAWPEGGTFDASEDKIQEMVFTLAVLARPTQAVMT